MLDERDPELLALRHEPLVEQQKKVRRLASSFWRDNDTLNCKSTLRLEQSLTEKSGRVLRFGYRMAGE